MALKKRKLVYRDVSTGRLIPKKWADERDPDTWVAEQFSTDNYDHMDEKPLERLENTNRKR